MSPKVGKILILGGTREAADLAEKLVNEDHDVTTSLAGRTIEPAPLAGATRSGGFGGANGLEDYLRTNGFTRLIDATHPFAFVISENAKAAALRLDIEFDQITRPAWVRQPRDIWIEVETYQAAREVIPHSARVFLALGSQHIAPFAGRSDVRFIVRMIDPPAKALPIRGAKIVLAKPSMDWRKEQDLMLRHEISHMVCRNSGGAGAYAKIEAARHLRIPVIMIQRPT